MTARVAFEFATPDEWRQIQEDACQRFLGVDRATFLAGWASGVYGWDEPLAATSVAMLFSDDDLAGDQPEEQQ